MSKSSSKSSEAQKSSGASGPWAYSMPAVKSFTDTLASAGGIGMTPDQTSAFGVLKNNAAAGNPFTQQTANLANDSFNTADRSGTVGQAYTNMQNQLGGYASGSMNDPASNPYLSQMMEQAGTKAFDKINAQFAGAGRDLSGMNSMAAARGFTEASLPLAFNQYNQNVANQFQAANSLYGAGQNTAATQSALDAQRQAMRAGGVTQGQAALDANNYGANTILNLDQQIKDLPYEDLSRVANLLYPLAGLGGTQTGTGQGNATSTTSGFNLNALLGRPPTG